MPKPADNKPAQMPLGRRARKALAVRQALFDAGLAAFERQPIGLVSVLDITERADVAKGVFYLQFRSKDDYLVALWEHVQMQLLDTAGARASGRRSLTSRLEAIAGALLDIKDTQPAAARFWLRMASFFPDEIGEPGQLAKLHQTYVDHIAMLIAGKSTGKPDRQNRRMAQLMDAFAWAAIGSAFQGDAPDIDARQIVRAVQAGCS